jgi:hypothetical protein
MPAASDEFLRGRPSVWGPGARAAHRPRSRSDAFRSKVIAGITTSVDGYITGPDDGPGCGLGVGGERLHYWVFGGPWTYDDPGRGEPIGEDKAWLDDPVVLGDGKTLFEGFTRSIDLEHLGVRQSPYATFIDYRVRM